MKAQPWKFKLRKELAEHPFWDDQAMVWVHALSAQGTGESPDGMEPDDAGVQPQTVLNLVSFEKLMAAVGVKVPQSA